MQDIGYTLTEDTEGLRAILQDLIAAECEYVFQERSVSEGLHSGRSHLFDA